MEVGETIDDYAIDKSIRDWRYLFVRGKDYFVSFRELTQKGQLSQHDFWWIFRRAQSIKEALAKGQNADLSSAVIENAAS